MHLVSVIHNWKIKQNTFTRLLTFLFVFVNIICIRYKIGHHLLLLLFYLSENNNIFCEDSFEVAGHYLSSRKNHFKLSIINILQIVW